MLLLPLYVRGFLMTVLSAFNDLIILFVQHHINLQPCIFVCSSEV